LKKPSLFVVEDSVEMQKTLKEVFTRLGCEVVLAPSAEEALAKFQGGYLPDVLILDFKLPGMNGPQLYRKLAKEPRWSGIPVVPFTSQWSDRSKPALQKEWTRLVQNLTHPEAPEVVPKKPGDEFTLPEHLVMTVANHLKTSKAGLPKVFEEAILDLVNRVMALLKEADAE
jgi:CheY-like chemotaxis protein